MPGNLRKGVGYVCCKEIYGVPGNLRKEVGYVARKFTEEPKSVFTISICIF